MDARTAIEQLVYRYAACVDAGDFAGVAELFARGRMTGPDGTLLAEGRNAVLAFYTATIRLYPETGTPQTQHVMSNLVLDIDEDAGRARGRCNYTVFQKVADSPLQAIICGAYNDLFEREQGLWRFAERQTVPGLYGDLSRHLLRFGQQE